MKSIGIVICNYNKKEYVVECIQAVVESNSSDYDIFVVDNASTDGSVDEIRRRFGNKVYVIENEKNLGGSGGFNSGIRKVVEEGYPYVCCLDNDAFIDENALQAMFDFLEEEEEVGMVGAKIYFKGKESIIQQFGLKIDFEHFYAKTLYNEEPDCPEIPEVVYCDTVAACVAMVRTSVIKEVGVMPEDNFIYWDDMEWGYRIKQAGYKVAAISSAKAIHIMGANEKKKDTFISYYMWRNRIHFFMKYTPKDQLERMSVVLLCSIFTDLYEAIFKEEHNIEKTIYWAFMDSINGIRGKALEDRILENDGNIKNFIELFQDEKELFVQGDKKWMKDILEYFNFSIVIKEEEDENTLKVKVCDSIFRVNEFEKNTKYVDYNLLVVRNDEDAEFAKNFEFAKGLFIYMNQDMFLKRTKIIQENLIEKMSVLSI